MKVLIVALAALPPIGGTSERIWRISKGLAKMGLDVTVYMGVHSQVKEERNLHPFNLPSSQLDLLNVLKWFVHLLCRSKTSDIVQIECFSPFRSLILCVLLKPLARGLVLVLHDKYWLYDPRKGRLMDKVEYLLQHFAFCLYDKIIVTGKELKEWYLFLHGTEFSDKVIVIYSGVPLVELKEYDQPMKEKFGLPMDAFIALFFGSMLFEPNRNAVRYIYQVSEKVAKRFEELTKMRLLFIVAGIGTKSFERTQFVIPLGFVNDVFELLAVGDVCVIPHEPSYSGPHVKTLYSFAAGKPVVSTMDGVKDMPAVESDAHFLLFKMEDVNSLVDALARLALNGELRERICNNAYVHARSYTWEHIAERHYRIYEKLCYKQKSCERSR